MCHFISSTLGARFPFKFRIRAVEVPSPFYDASLLGSYVGSIISKDPSRFRAPIMRALRNFTRLSAITEIKKLSILSFLRKIRISSSSDRRANPFSRNLKPRNLTLKPHNLKPRNLKSRNPKSRNPKSRNLNSRNRRPSYSRG